MNRLVILAAGFLVLFIGGGARFAIGLTLKPIAEELGVGRTTLGLAVAVYFIATSVSMFLAGRLADAFSIRLVLVAGLLVSAVGMGLMCVLSEPWQIFAYFGLLFAVGNGIASITPVSVMVSRAYPDKAGFANGIVSAGMSAGQLLIIGAFAMILAHSGWRAIFFWGALAHLVLLPILVRAVPVSGDQGYAAPSKAPILVEEGLSLRHAARTRPFWLLLGIYALCGFDDFFVSTHVVAFAQDRGVDALLAGHLLALMGLVGFAGVIAAGAWSDKAGPVTPAVACFLLRIAAFALIVVDQSPLAIAAFALLFGLTFLMTAPLLVIFARAAFGMANLGAITGLIVMIHHMCGGLGAWIGAALFDANGSYDWAFALMLASSVLACLFSAALARK
ncbi:MAG TPA: MFS transporter [Hyphomicrobiaceae bacterium]|jgi:predicted MFS family arabinose efflux permease|nr:MFS transporter [Hyphomicrobiaceae bacterium]